MNTTGECSPLTAGAPVSAIATLSISDFLPVTNVQPGRAWTCKPQISSRPALAFEAIPSMKLVRLSRVLPIITNLLTCPLELNHRRLREAHRVLTQPGAPLGFKNRHAAFTGR